MCEDFLEKDVENINLPWILFEVNKNTYAVNSENVISIIKMTDEIISVPDIQNYIRGVIDLRGSIIPLIDLKIVFGEKSYDEIIADYKSMINIRKKEHTAWVNELENCIINSNEFTLCTDAHECNLGKWYYNYKPQNNSLQYHMKKLEEPHEKLHSYALEYNNILKNIKLVNKQEKIDAIFKEIKEELYPQIISLLDESIDTMKLNLKEMIVVLEYNNFKAGIIVDKVSSIENIENSFEQGDMDDLYYNTKYVTGIGKSEKSKKSVMKINLDNILSKAAHIDLEDLEKTEETEEVEEIFNK
ncbi:chemotaxis protein CheW [Sedimentibacter sp. zth1]|uniref:chemotaxis protein CheW n=1 Tax=Sedimentibacter sp. zth1 TaxID=2816908 RepID=UPI001A92928F|nr:chemotaxis protein CheW [Sedimentibacter sp. zth1]QSX06022.1 chemotaxis protein CheW [Sedimentibacter sp. zth1]